MLTSTPETTLTPSSPALLDASDASSIAASPDRRTGLLRLLPPAEVIRFLIVGACNTLFSILLQAGFAVLIAHLFPRLTQSFVAMAAVICATPFGVTFSFMGFKHFVFKTHGNYIKEWIRCFAVYSPTIPAAIIIVGIATRLFEMTALPHAYAKDAAFVVNSAIIAAYSYFGHKKFSFRK